MKNGIGSWYYRTEDTSRYSTIPINVFVVDVVAFLLFSFIFILYSQELLIPILLERSRSLWSYMSIEHSLCFHYLQFCFNFVAINAKTFTECRLGKGFWRLLLRSKRRDLVLLWSCCSDKQSRFRVVAASSSLTKSQEMTFFLDYFANGKQILK